MKKLFVLICFMVLNCAVSAQDSEKETFTDNTQNLNHSEYGWSWENNHAIPFSPPPPPVPVPIDGGVGFLLVGGGLWGIRNLRKKSKQ